ncbi:SIR2 family protein [Chryseobacterium sp. SL1]|uniref:SIR2 family protein n=1 Tax=Chryseobacterium sp. SL1 TaxID=2995159 RepID=UPI002DD44D7F|nr:SIR2 family protein [Chryseobacterium sp. SL1]
MNTTHSLDSKIHKLLWELSSKIITTNYDQILEFNKPLDPSIDVFGNENSYLALKSQKEDSKFLYKIHGDFKNPETIILFESDYNIIYSDKNANEDALGDFFKNKTFLFLGFSLSDPFINNLFTRIKNLYSNYTVGNHYIFSINDQNDFSSFDVKLIKIDNWKDSLEDYLKILIEEKSNNIQIISHEKGDNINEEINILEDDIDSLFILIKSKTEELKKDPGNRILASEMHDLRSKIDQLIYGELDCLKTIDKEYKNNHLRMLFETIYGNEKLSQETINEINRIRTDYINHQWYERCQLISALTCSLFIFNKADDKKISLLVDFINDNEDKVWERSLTYLVMILNHLGNKWLRFEPIKRKVKSLTLNLKVQDACQKIIEYILVFGIGNFNFSEKVFENPYFRDNPFNYFLPFFKENNPLFDNIYDNYEGEDIDEFIDFLEKSPYPDSLKYIICNTPKIAAKENNNEQSIHKEAVIHHLMINENYFPFAGYIQEFVSFIKGFPTFQHKRLIDTQLKITSTPLKDYLLSEKEKFRVLGIHFHKEKNWGQAIINFEKYLKFQPDDIMILDNIANCYLSNKESDKAKSISKQIYSILPNEKFNLIRLADIYSSEKRYDKTLSMMNKYIDIDPKYSLIHFKRSLVLLQLEKFDEALLSIQLAEEQDYDDKLKLYKVYAIIYKRLEKFEESIKYFDKAISLDENNPDLYLERSESYEYQGNYEKSIEDIDCAINIESKEDYLLSKAYLLLSANKIDEAFIILSKIRDKNTEYHNALANYYRLKGKFDDAFSVIDLLLKNSDYDKRFLGTKAAIYSSLNDDENFYKYLDEVLSNGVDVKKFMPDIKLKYKDKNDFNEILKKHNQKLY